MVNEKQTPNTISGPPAAGVLRREPERKSAYVPGR
jgi:hypothetical protein